MGIKEILRKIVEETGGAMGAVVMGYDGIAIEDYLPTQGTLDVQLLAVEFASVLKEIKRTVGVLKTGSLEEVSISAGACRIIVRSVSDDCFAALVIAPEANFGKGRYLMQLCAPKLRESLQW